ncbi:oxidoreductase [Cadophora sp. DSE1049]|nr:oxidoreductase [Cadophora sp. DSE1049]
MTTSFSAIPVVDYSQLLDPGRKAEALSQLRDAVFNVGFLYLTKTGLESLIKEVHQKMPEIFALPQEVKESCNMRNSPSFLGYTALGSETTATKTDIREQFDFGTPVKKPWDDSDPFWRKLEGPSQFPNAEVKSIVQRYTTEMSKVALIFVRLVAECLSLPPTTFDTFVGEMSRIKLDSIGLFTFLSQDNVGGLQVLNKSGEWIDAAPMEGSIVVNIAQGFEAITGGVCPGTTHRVKAPTEVTRYSIPFFLAVRLDLTLEELKHSAAHIVQKIPVSDDRKKRAGDVPSELISPLYSCIGEAQLRNRIFSHPDVGREWYPDLLTKYSRELLS